MFYFQHPGAPRIRPTHAEEQREVWLELLMQDVAEENAQATRFPYPMPAPEVDEEEAEGEYLYPYPDPYHPDHGEG